MLAQWSGVRPPCEREEHELYVPIVCDMNVGVVPRGLGDRRDGVDERDGLQEVLGREFPRLASACPRGSRGFLVRPRRPRARRRRPAASIGLGRPARSYGRPSFFSGGSAIGLLGTKLCAALTSARVMMSVRGVMAAQ